jgi:hypothetical protein
VVPTLAEKAGEGPGATTHELCLGRIDLSDMRGSITRFILPLLVLPSLSLTQTVPTPPEPDKDPFVGTWKASADKSRPKLSRDEAAYVRTLSRDGDDIVFSSRAKGPVSGYSEHHYRIRCDGLPHPVPCGDLACTKSCTYKAPNRVEGEETSANGRTYWTEEVSTNGREMRISVYKDEARTRLEGTEVLDRVK